MALTRSTAATIFSPEGNSLAVFIDVTDGELKLKDVFGNVSPFVNIATPTYYAAFSSSILQNIGTNVEKAITVNTTDVVPLGIELVGDSEFKVLNDGVYNVAISAQVQHTSGGSSTTSWWFKVNGQNVSNSATDMRLRGNGVEEVFYVNAFLNLNANDKIQIFWSSTDSASQLYAIGIRTSPTRPAVPSVIITINSVAV
jgi:hypothetical protein